jgi:ATP-binding cassette subfamily B protein
MMMGGSGERSMDFKGSGKRLLRTLSPERRALWLMLSFGVLSVVLAAIGPKILAEATDLVFAGVVGREMPHGPSKAQALEALRAKGEGGLADMLSGVDFTPGAGIDFTAVGHVLLVALAVYVAAGLLMLVSTRMSIRVINRTVYRMREDVQAKLSRLPLSYFDKAKRGEVLSRATNDIDNIAQTMQQSMGQLVNSLLTIVAVLAMMFWISPLLALVALVTVPLSVYVATKVGMGYMSEFVQYFM